MNTVLWIIVSFFAVVGFIDTVVTFVDSLSFLKYNCIKSATLNVKLSGEIDNIPFLLNSLILTARKINFKDNVTTVSIDADETEPHTYNEIREFCLENNDVTVL